MRSGRSSPARRMVWQASCGFPPIIIPQLPQIAIRHDQRNDRVPSMWSLMCCSACRTDMPSVYGMS